MMDIARPVDQLERRRRASNLVVPLSRAADHPGNSKARRAGVESDGIGTGWDGMGKPREDGVSAVGKKREPMTNEAIDVSR